MLTSTQKDKLIAFGQALINQEQARIIVEPYQPRSGFWFGGGNLIEAADGTFYLVGRYRNFGDSRTGLGAGERGLELAIFKSEDRGQSFGKILSLSKKDLSTEAAEVLSIEGAALHQTAGGIELFISSEKGNLAYPPGLEAFHKPNTGVWTIDHLQADTVSGLGQAEIKPLLACRDPQFLHVKDPFLLDQANGDLLLGFVTHPFSWASSNSGYMRRPAGAESFTAPVYNFFPRGFTWDIAISRITAWLPLPQVGAFAFTPPLSLLFYDGGESMRNLDEHSQAVKRPRGYSCEELGGLAVAAGDGVSNIERLSLNLPMFVSPNGFGTSRYVDVLVTAEGYYATWEQSQPDLSQALMLNFVSRQSAEQILA